jgi:signal transduction histidine kinase
MTVRSLVAAFLYLLPAVVFTEIARQLWTFRRVRRAQSRLFQLLPIATTVLAVHYDVLVACALVPAALSPTPLSEVLTPWHAGIEVSWIVSLALVRHLLRLTPLPEDPPSTVWLVGNYGFAAGGAIALLTLRLWPGATATQQLVAHRVFEATSTTLGLLCFAQFARTARPGTWGPEAAGEMRGPDVRMVRIGITAAFLSVPIVWLAGGGEFSMVAFEVLMGLAIAAPMATRMAGHALPESMVTIALVLTTALLLAAYTYALPRVAAPYRPLLGAGAVLAILAVATTGWRLARVAAVRLVFGRRVRRLVELQTFMPHLSPELGVVECCRRVLAEVVRLRQIPGAAIILADGEALVDGSFDLDRLRRVWPTGDEAAALPAGGYGTLELRELPLVLREALVQAEVGLGAAAIRSRRRHWGHLFMRAGFFGGTFREDDAEAFEAFVDQLALLLDAADLLARTVAVERSLAHAEKLAAIGELAARFAHEIRNPVTAARSLAQQLARDPTSPLNAEHAGIILDELERVERQVRDLLRFARREEIELAPVDLGALVRATAHALGARLAAGGIVLGLDTPDGVVARADREKVRRVLVNLLENAMDALQNGRPEKHIDVVVTRDGEQAIVRVVDDGPGIPAEAHARVFDPFVSFKPSGTGLGLAIAKRTIDAHHGSISVTSRPGATTFEIRLPRAPE